MLIETAIDSVRVSLMSQHRVIVLKDPNAPRFLPIWIGPFEADAITIELQGVEVGRPLTHDLLRQVIETLDAEIEQVAITTLRNDTFFAEITLITGNGRRLQVDSRPSDAIALAVRARVPIYVEEDVLDQAAITPEPDLETGETGETVAGEEAEAPEAFREFLEGLDLGGLGN